MVANDKICPQTNALTPKHSDSLLAMMTHIYTQSEKVVVEFADPPRPCIEMCLGKTLTTQTALLDAKPSAT